MYDRGVIRAAIAPALNSRLALAGGFACAVLACRPVNEASPETPPASQTIDTPHFAWPHWGGPRRDFHLPDIVLSPDWPPDGPPIVWTRPLGDGYSAIVSDDERLFTMYREAEEEVVVALSRENGATLWMHRYAAPIDFGDHPQGYGWGPRSTPLVLGDRLYAAGFNGVMHCLDRRDGRVIWRRDLIRDYAGTVNRWGYACSPLAWNDTIIMLVGGKGRSVVALDARDGRLRWGRHDFANSYASGKLIEAGGRVHVVCFMAREVVGLDPDNGARLWSHAHENQWLNNISDPVWGEGGLLFLSSEGDGGARVIELRASGPQITAGELWATRKVRISHRNAIRIGDFIYCTSGDFGPAFFTAVNVRDGTFAWRHRGYKESCLLALGDKLLVLDEDGWLSLATATPESLTIHARARLLEREAWTVPTVIGRRVYLRDRKTARAIELP